MQVSQETRGDERLLLLAIALDRRVGLTFDELCEQGLLGDPDGKEETLRKSLLRACRSFDEMGIKVVDEMIGGERRYRIEARLTYARPSEVNLDAGLAPDLLAAVTAYLQGSQRPYDGDVRRAREKLASVLGLSSSPVMSRLGAGRVDPACEAVYHTLLDCRTKLVECRFEYRNARGVRAEHTVRPYGFFDRGGKSYVVAFDAKHIDEDPVRVFRLDRIDADTVAVLKRSYAVPDDFNVNDYTWLPFEYGDDENAFTARFVCDSDLKHALESLTQGRGSWQETPQGWSWSIVARNVDACASWAVGAWREGLIVQGPDELLSRIVAGIGKAARDHA